MEKIISAIPFYYGASEETPNTAAVAVEMKDRIDGKLLAEVVPQVMERYPYFMVRTVVSDNEYVLEYNPEPIMVSEGSTPPVLGGKDTNGHLLSFAYKENYIYLFFFHGLADGAGIFPLIRSLLYYYCCRYYHAELDSTGINLIGSAINAEEINDPYPDHVDETIHPIGRYQRKATFQLKDGGKIHTEDYTLYRIRVPEDAFIKYTKAKDGSPATMFSVFLYRAIKEIHPDAKLPIVCGMAMNIRSVLQKPACHHSVVSQIFLEYKPTMEKMDIQTLATCSRGMVFLQSQPENVWTSVRNNMAFFETIQNLPDIPSKKSYMRQVVERSMRTDTYKVSYVGKSALGSVEQYVAGIDSYVDIAGAGIMMEINEVNGWFHLCFMQEFKEDVYVNSFIRQLENEGIPCIIKDGEPFRVPGICL